jgi:hypothetical protein
MIKYGIGGIEILYSEQNTRQRNIKLTPALDEMLEVIAKYEGITSVPVLIREWIRDHVKRYQTNPRFKRYLKTHPEEAKHLAGLLP